MGSYHSDYDLHLSDSLLATTHKKVSNPSSAMKLQFPPKKPGALQSFETGSSRVVLSCDICSHKIPPTSGGDWPMDPFKIDCAKMTCWNCHDVADAWHWREGGIGSTDGYDSRCRGCIPIRLNIFFSNCGINILRADRLKIWIRMFFFEGNMSNLWSMFPKLFCSDFLFLRR